MLMNKLTLDLATLTILLLMENNIFLLFLDDVLAIAATRLYLARYRLDNFLAPPSVSLKALTLGNILQYPTLSSLVSEEARRLSADTRDFIRGNGGACGQRD